MILVFAYSPNVKIYFRLKEKRPTSACRWSSFQSVWKNRREVWRHRWRLIFFNPASKVHCVFFQFEVNKRRDTELLKLRKLLEDVHLESEETTHLLKRKHQEIIVDFQEQIEVLSKAKARYVLIYLNFKKIVHLKIPVL